MSATAISFEDWHEAEMADLHARIDVLVDEANDRNLLQGGGVMDSIHEAKGAWYRGNPAEVERAIAELRWLIHREREWYAESLATAAYIRGASR